MLLPGGLFLQDRLRRDFRFRPMTGQAEMSLAESVSSSASLPERVTGCLAVVLESVGEQAADADLVRSLTVPDRQFLMRLLGIRLGSDRIWLTPSCSHCGKAFDVPVTQSELPVKPPGEGFPEATVETSLGNIRVRVPVGRDQEAIAGISDAQEARKVLARYCIVDAELMNRRVVKLTETDLLAIEAAVERISPELTVSVRADCPECRSPQSVPVDPYQCLRWNFSGIFEEVHTIASAYHWSESQILSLTRSRRKRYLSLIRSRSRGSSRAVS